MSEPRERTGLAIITDLLSLTRQMAEKLDDADFLVASVDRREELMAEYDRVKAAPYAKEQIEKDKPEISRMIAEVVALDKTISNALTGLMTQVKRELTNASAQKKVLGYTNNAISSSGSYMDYKK